MNPLKKSDGLFRKPVRKVFSYLEDFLHTSAGFARNKVSEGIVMINDIKAKSKDLINTNLEVARLHIRNNNLTDAKFRFKIVLRMQKNNFSANLGLGFLYLLEGKKEKSLKYYQLALENCTEEGRRKEIKDIIRNVKKEL